MVEIVEAVEQTARPKEILARDYQPIQKSENVRKYVQDYFADIPLMKEIARCESQYRQYDATGVVLRGKVNSGDVGVMQINEYYHLKTAAKMGLDIHTIDGNVRYARYLYEREGAQPWISSSPCWSKVSESEIAMK